MSDYVKRANGVADQYLAALAESQEQFLKTLTAFSSWVPKAPAAAAPVTAELPTPKEVVEANFAFAAKLLKQQKDFTEKLVAATTPAN
ncbi:MAG TPA: hypothetical protein VM819_14150 [Vicinamibacterales bacterium]|jgi:hypothetical protein|nr:hypothetical protein [Vicinamibacterales bacterium]